MTEVIPPFLDSQKYGIFKALAHLDPHLLIGHESDGMNSFKGEAPFVGEDTRIMKSMRALEPAEKPEAVPHMEGPPLPLYKKEEMAFHRGVTVSGDPLLGFDQKLGPGPSPLRGTIDGPLQQ